MNQTMRARDEQRQLDDITSKRHDHHELTSSRLLY